MIHRKALKTAEYIQIQNVGALNKRGICWEFKKKRTYRIAMEIHLFHLFPLPIGGGNQVTFLTSHCSHWVASKLLLIPGSSSPWELYQYAGH